MKKLFLILVCASFAALSSCKEDAVTPSNTIVKGGDSTFGISSKAYAWTEFDPSGNPVSIGITFPDSALTTMPMGANEFILPIPQGAGKLIFNHVSVNFQMMGHEPMEVYGKPHLDVHFQMFTPEERAVNNAGPGDSARVMNLPAKEYMPATYFSGPYAPIPGQGIHWIDGLAPELNGGAFTQTMIMGSYDGKVMFWEPMITKAFFDAKGSNTFAIKQPTKYAVSGYYPTKYSIKYDATNKTQTVSLHDMVKR